MNETRPANGVLPRENWPLRKLFSWNRQVGPTDGRRSIGLLLLRRRGGGSVPGGCHIAVEVLRVAAVPAPPGQNDAAHAAPVAGHLGCGVHLRRARVPRTRFLHRVVRSRNLHPEPSDRVPVPSGGSRDSGTLRWTHLTHQGLRWVPPLRSPTPRVQILVPNVFPFPFLFALFDFRF